MGRREKVSSGSIDMIQVANWFFRDHMSKVQIARALTKGRNISVDPRTVAGIIQRALDTGVVKVLIQETFENSPLERQLRETYPHLKKVFVLPRTGEIKGREDYVEMLQQFAATGARYLEQLIREHGSDRSITVAVGGGETVTEVITAMREQSRPNVRIRVPTLVGHGFLGPQSTHLSPSHNALLLWRRLGSIPGAVGFATTPPLPRQLNQLEGSLKKLAANPDIHAVLKDMASIDIVFAGIGAVDAPGALAPLKNGLTMTSLVQHLIQPKMLIDLGAVADFSYQFIDAFGKAIRRPGGRGGLRFFLSAGYTEGQSSLDFFRDMINRGKDVVAIGGPHKIAAIMAALNGKLFNTLITDEVSAQDILLRTRSSGHRELSVRN